MRKNKNIRDVLGITQEELAMLLGITRTQLAMYETKKRDIPLSAKQKLAELLTSLQKNKSISEYSNQIIATVKKKAHEWLQKEFKELEYKVLLLDRKIKKSMQVREEAFKALEVVQYLESKKDKEQGSALRQAQCDNLSHRLAKTIKNRAEKTLNKNSLQHLYELQLKKESLEMLKLQIEKKLKF